MEFVGPDAERWDRLATQSRNVFQTRDFAESWWATYQPRGDIAVLTDNEEAPQCILPLYRRGRGVPLIRQIGHGPADALGPLCAPEHRQLAKEMIRTELRRDLRRGVLVMHDVPADDEWAEQLGGDIIRTTPGPAVHLDVRGWEEFLASRSKNFRGQVRGKRNRLERAFDMTIRTSALDTLEQDMTTMLRLHRLRWGADAPFARGKQAELARRFARLSIERDRLRLSIMELNGRPVAALLGLRFAGVHSFWQSGRDPDYEQHSIGSVLLMDAIRGATEDHAVEYRLLRGGEAYKQRLADRARDTCTVAVGRGALGAVAINAARTRRAGQQRLKALRATIANTARRGVENA